ncbi:MAG: hypothetical protein K0R41_2164, partial [Geminicoccaceae bacterium]|nr:hypothetical protein [Geminicoccaceae bacterium]
MSSPCRFLTGLVIGAAGLPICLAVLFLGLDGANALKAPSFAGRLGFDEKLRILRADPPQDVQVLFAGSSTTLHGLDGALLQSDFDMGGELLNLGVQGLRVNQIKFLVDVFVTHFPSIDAVVMISTLLDFKNCSSVETEFFDHDDVLGYVSGRMPELYYYFRYLDLRGIVRRAREIGYLRNTIHDLESVAFDDYGSVLLDVPRDGVIDRVWHGDVITLDPPCYTGLRALAEALRDQGIAFTFVLAPMRPGYLAGRDPDGSLLTEHRAETQAALAGTDAMVIDAHAVLDMPEEAFFDAYHLKRDETQKLTHFIGEEMLTHS